MQYGHYQGHMNKHLNLKPFVCQLCRKAFANSTSLRRHNRDVHNLAPGVTPCLTARNQDSAEYDQDGDGDPGSDRNVMSAAPQ